MFTTTYCKEVPVITTLACYNWLNSMFQTACRTKILQHTHSPGTTHWAMCYNCLLWPNCL